MKTMRLTDLVLLLEITINVNVTINVENLKCCFLYKFINRLNNYWKTSLNSNRAEDYVYNTVYSTSDNIGGRF